MKLERQLKLALDESRLLILGSQVLFGFQFSGIFQQGFEDLAPLLKMFMSAALCLITVTIALLVTPSLEHRIVRDGQDHPSVLSLTTRLTTLALPPLAVALALDLFVAMERIAGLRAAVGIAAAFFALAMAFWYGLAFALKRKESAMATAPKGGTPLDAQVEQLLTEARLVLPGVQALLGFQLTVTLTQAFQELLPGARFAHAIALSSASVAIVLLMAPASLHRISFGGQDDPKFVALASWFVVAAPLPLALAIALDTYVALGRALSSQNIASAAGVGTILVLVGIWYGFPVGRRLMRRDARN
jgi:hypothetical protein